MTPDGHIPPGVIFISVVNGQPKKGQGVKRTRVTWSPPPGFSNIYKKKYQLALFWYKEPKAPRTQSDKPQKMDDEIGEFSNIAEIKDKFSATTYQDFFEALKTTCCGLSEHDEYITYLRDRYFPQNN